jgi:hypothetical protein
MKEVRKREEEARRAGRGGELPVVVTREDGSIDPEV